MAEFTELIRNFDKIRDYMRDFYIYGFKSRGEFEKKSLRSYDNERRRIESYLGEHIGWSYDSRGKSTFVALNTASTAQNPFYAAWKAKTFTSNDLMLHFALLDLLSDGQEKTAGQLTDEACRLLQHTFDIQTVRNKCREYEKQGLFKAFKQGKQLFYSLQDQSADAYLAHAVAFFTEVAPFGEIGSFIMDDMNWTNRDIRFKHHFIVHTLEDGILIQLMQAMKQHRWIEVLNFSEKLQKEGKSFCVPLKILISTVTGRRYVCGYQNTRQKFVTYRLDNIKSIVLGNVFPYYEKERQTLLQELPLVWGVSFANRRKQILCMKLTIDEKTESYVLERLHREGRGGEILQLDTNIFLYTAELYDIGEISSWVKTFIGRIISLEGSDPVVINRFYRDMERMREMYLPQPQE